MYRELREVANEFGLQITDMVKIFIKEGLERRLEKKKKLSLSEERIEVLEGEIFRLKDTVDELFRKIEELSDKIEEMKTPIEPEFVETA